MAKQSQAYRVIMEFEDGDIATLVIPSKMHLKTKSKRLLVQILLGDYGQYKVMSQHSWISSQQPSEELNKVSANLVELLGGNIPIEAEYKAGKEVQIQLTKAVALENNQGSITTAQKASQGTKTIASIGLGSRSRSSSKLGLDTELANALATAQNAVSAAANALASSPPVVRQLNQQTATPLNQVDVQNPSPLRLRRQLFTQSQSSPIRQPQSQVSPEPEPVKRTRKQRALMEDHREVDMGPRKLQSRK